MKRPATSQPAKARPSKVPSAPAGGEPLLALAFLLSGSAGLIHEVVWVRLLGHVFGVTAFAVGTVLAAFMGGLAVGAFLAGRRTAGLAHPARVYAWVEFGIGLFSLAVPLLLAALEPVYGWGWRRFHASFAVFSVVRFVLAGGLLLAPTIMMGATLPLLVEHFARRSGRRAAPEWLYTINLAGAALGVAAAGFLLLPMLGVRLTIVTGSAINFLAGGLVLLWSRGARHDVGAAHAAPPPGAGPAKLLLAAAFLSGFVSLAGQVAWTRLAALLIGSTTYAFSTVLLVVLGSLALGSAWVSRRRDAPASIGPSLARLGALASLALVFSIGAVHMWPTWYWKLSGLLQPAGLVGVVALNVTAMAAILTPPVLLAGTLLPLALAGVRGQEPEGAARALGILCAVNTVGAILGSLLGGFALVPWIGSSATLKGVAALTALFAVAVALREGSGRQRIAVPGAAAVAVGALLLLPAWDPKLLNAAIYEPRPGIDPRDKNPLDTVVYHREGPTATVIVVQRPPTPSACASTDG